MLWMWSSEGVSNRHLSFFISKKWVKKNLIKTILCTYSDYTGCPTWKRGRKMNHRPRAESKKLINSCSLFFSFCWKDGEGEISLGCLPEEKGWPATLVNTFWRETGWITLITPKIPLKHQREQRNDSAGTEDQSGADVTGGWRADDDQVGSTAEAGAGVQVLGVETRKLGGTRASQFSPLG